jgi:hypothetical protein
MNLAQRLQSTNYNRIYYIIMLQSLLITFSTLMPVVLSDHSTTTTTTTIERDLQQQGDFAELNAILQNLIIEVPENPPPLTSGGITMDLYSIVCKDIQISNALLASRRLSASDVELQVTLSGLDFTCQSRYKYTGALGVTGRGDVYVVSGGNQAVATATLSSSSFSDGMYDPPTHVVMKSCNPTIQIVDIDFANGGIISWTLDLLEGMLRDTMERLAEQQICNELSLALQGQTKEFLSYAKKTLKRYTDNDPSTLWTDQDLLAREQELDDKDLRLLNLQQQDTNTGRWIHQLLDKGVDYLNTAVSSANGSAELQLNTWLRNYVLDDNGALILEQSENGAGFVIFKGHDIVTQTTIAVDRVKLIGLDSFTRFDPIKIPTGKYTLQTSMAWEYLGLEIDATVTIRPSTLDDSIIVDSQARPIVEKVSAYVGITDLEASTALLTAIDRTTLEGIRLGSLLSKDHIMDCLMSTMHELDLTSMALDASDVVTPSISGLVSPGIDRVLSNVMDAAFLIYEPHMLKASPSYFQKEIRPLLNEKLLGGYFLKNDDGNRRNCLLTFSWLKTGHVDFRDLFLSPEESVAFGGSGKEPYGDLFSGMIMPYLRENFLEPSSLRSLTKEQSGKEGVLQFVDVFEYKLDANALYDYLDFKISKLTIENLDTIVNPLVLQPVEKNVLVNELGWDAYAGMNNQSRPLNVTIRASLDVGGPKSPLQMKNEVDFSIVLPSTRLNFEVLANLKERTFFEFPLEYLTNPYCWLAALGVDHDLDQSMDRDVPGFAGGVGFGNLNDDTKNEDQGTRVQQDQRSLVLSSLAFSLSNFILGSTCIVAGSPGCHSISEVLDRLQQAGLSSRFRESIVALVEDIIYSLWANFDAPALVQAAPTYCPYSDTYVPEKKAPEIKFPGISGLSSNSSETILALGIIGIEAAIVVSANNQLLRSQQQDNSSVSNVMPNPFPEGSDILDWQNLTVRWGSWVDLAFDEFCEYLSTPVDPKREIRKKPSESTTPRVNVLLQEYVLDKEGALVFDLQDFGMASLGFSVSAARARITGLNSVTNIDPLIVMDSNTLKTKIKLDTLTIEIELDVTTIQDNAEQIKLAYSFREIDLEVDTRIALNTTKVGEIQLGSIFDVSEIDSCLMRGVQALEISKLNFAAKEIDSPSVAGYLSERLAGSVSALVELLHTDYQDDIIEAMPLMINSTIRETINALIPDMLESMAIRCPSPPHFEADGLIDFRDMLLSDTASSRLGGSGTSPYGNLFVFFYDMLEKEVMQTGASNRPVLNDLLMMLTEKQSNITGTIQVAGKAIDSQSTIRIAGLEAELRIQVSDILIQNLDSVGDPLYLLRPMNDEANILDNTLSFGVDRKPLTFAATLILSISDGVEMNIRNEVKVSFLVADVSLQLAFLLQVLENSISSFPFEDFSNWNCWLSTIMLRSDGRALNGIQIMSQGYSTGNFTMEITCKSCTSPDFDDLLMSLYAPSDVTAAIQEQTNSLLEAGFVQSILESLIYDSKKRCPHHPEFDPAYVAESTEELALLPSAGFSLGRHEEDEKPMYFNIASTIISGLLCVIGIAGKISVARQNKKWMQSLTDEGRFFLCRQNEKKEAMGKWLDNNTKPLVSNPFISKKVRWGVPVAILLNIGLFLGGHLGLLSIVNLDVSLAGESFTVYNFMEFSFLESTKKTFNNGGAEMVILIWIFTGIWPYTKLFLSLFAWLAPTKYLSVKRRGVLLTWIDALAKLSVVDIFTLILGVAILLVFIGGPDKSLSSDGVYYSLKAIVVPQAGCYCLLIAQRMSRVSSRFLLEYHETVVNEANRIRLENEVDMSVSRVVLEETVENESHSEIDPPSIQITDQDDGGDESFCNEDNQPAHDQRVSMDMNAVDRASLSRVSSQTSSSTLSSLKNYRWGYWGAILGLITIILIFTIGCIFAPAIAFDLTSIGGLAIESEKTFEDAVSEYGVFVVVSGILVRARFVLDNKVDYIGLGLLLAAVGISISLLFMIQSYHFIKRTLRERRKRRHNLDIPSYGHKGCGLPFYFRLFKWNHMEIYLISFAIGILQLGSIASYSIYIYCDIMTRIYEILSLLGIAEVSTAQCFDEQASNLGNLIIILGSFSILLIAFYFEASSQYKKNITDCMKYVDDQDVPRLSLAWSRDKSKNSRYSHLTDSLSLDFTESVRDLSTPPSSPALSRISSTASGRSSRSGGSPVLSTGSGRNSDPLRSIQRSSSQNINTTERLWLQDDLEVTSCPVASPCSVESSRSSGRSSVIDAACDFAACELAPGASPQMSFGENLPSDEDPPPLVASQSLDDDSHEEASSSFSLPSPPPHLSPPRRLSSILRGLAIRPRLSLPTPDTSARAIAALAPISDDAFVDDDDARGPSSFLRPRRVRSTEDILRYMEENPNRFE